LLNSDFLFSFTTPAVRDLAWVIQSPVLLNPGYKDFRRSREIQPEGTSHGDSLVIDDAWCEQQLRLHQSWLSELDAEPKDLLEWLAARQNPRLGVYFESLVEFWLRHANPDHRLIPHLQVKDAQRTVGEFDYLLEHDDKHHIAHWEVAVKFYLYYQHADGNILWYGPNSRDRLDIKLERLLQHQLRLSSYPAAADTLRHAGLTLPVLPQLLLKGCLFYPAQSDWRNPPANNALSARHLRGWWTYLDSFEIPNAGGERRWLYLPRLRWLAPAVADESDSALMTIEQLHGFCLDLLKRKQRPPLIAEMVFTEAGHWQEVSRGFVLPQYWPRHRPLHRQK
jgi:hypothetical protein